MYKNFYKMKMEAFGNLPLLKVFFNSNTHKNGWNYLLSGLSSREQFMLLTGDFGMGKTTLCLGFVRMLTRKGKIPFVYIPTPFVEYEEILAEISKVLQVEPNAKRGGDLHTVLFDHFRQPEKSQSLYIILDDAHELPTETISQLRALANFNHDGNFPFHFAFFAHSSFLQRLKTQPMIPLDQRIKRRAHLQHFSEAETKEYIYARLVKSGAPGIPGFTEEAIQLIHQKSKGIPRLINNACDAALLVGASKKLLEITSAVVREALPSAANVPPPAVEIQKAPSDRNVTSLAADPAPLPDMSTMPLQAAGKTPSTEKATKTLSISGLDNATTTPKTDAKNKRFWRLFIISTATVVLLCLLGYAFYYVWQMGRLKSTEAKWESRQESSQQAPSPSASYGMKENRFFSARQPVGSPEIRDESIQKGFEPAIDATPYDSLGAEKERKTGILKPPAPGEGVRFLPLAAGSDARRPYSLHMASYDILSHAQDAVAEYFKQGLEPYIVKVDLKNKGVWYRIYHGHYATRERARKEAERFGPDVTVAKTAYANLIGVYPEDTEMDVTYQKLRLLGYSPYSMTGSDGTRQLYVGAFMTLKGAEAFNRHLDANGIDGKVVKR